MRHMMVRKGPLNHREHTDHKDRTGHESCSMTVHHRGACNTSGMCCHCLPAPDGRVWLFLVFCGMYRAFSPRLLLHLYPALRAGLICFGPLALGSEEKAARDRWCRFD